MQQSSMATWNNHMIEQMLYVKQKPDDFRKVLAWRCWFVDVLGHAFTLGCV